MIRLRDIIYIENCPEEAYEDCPHYDDAEEQAIEDQDSPYHSGGGIISGGDEPTQDPTITVSLTASPDDFEILPGDEATGTFTISATGADLRTEGIQVYGELEGLKLNGQDASGGYIPYGHTVTDGGSLVISYSYTCPEDKTPGDNFGATVKIPTHKLNHPTVIPSNNPAIDELTWTIISDEASWELERP